MKNLSKFLTEHTKKRLFNSGSNAGVFQTGETFDITLERILHEGIFKYRKDLVFYSPVGEQVERIQIDAALLKVEANNPHDQRKKRVVMEEQIRCDFCNRKFLTKEEYFVHLSSTEHLINVREIINENKT